MGYPSDLTDKQWELIEEYFSVGKYGNRRKHSVRVLVTAVFYVIKSGCQWKMLPKDFPPSDTVWSFYRRSKNKGIWEKIMDSLVKKDRIRIGRTECPSYGVIDSQSVKTTTSAENRGIDGGKKNKRPKTTHSY
jgi:putative transposase